jgi:5-formyltetrahydrofolate cyclo-ligase
MRRPTGQDLAMEDSPAAIHELKRRVRREAHAARDRQPDKESVSRIIAGRCVALPEYQSAATVLLYLDARSEVRTGALLSELEARGRQIVVPYCVGDDLGLFHLENLEELAAGTYGILEPRPELRGALPKEVPADRLDLVIVPGVAFDRRGGRMGHGKGYYDRLLRRVRGDAVFVALAYECQMFPRIPMLPHDAAMDIVVTEAAVYRCDASQESTEGGGDSAGRALPDSHSLPKETP